MELTQAEKDRIIAEERCRLEAKKQLAQEQHGCCGHGFHRGGFWRGLLLGIVLSALAALVCHHHCGGYGRGCGNGYGHYGQGCHQHGQWAPQGPERDSAGDK